MTAEQALLTKLQGELASHNAYAICDRTTKPNNAEYRDSKAANRRNIRQTVSDLRWIRSGKGGIPPMLT